MLPKASEAYELDPADTSPFLDSSRRTSNVFSIDDLDPLKISHHPYTDDASQPLRSGYDHHDEKFSPEERQFSWIETQRRRGGILGWLIPSRFGCMLATLFFTTLLLLLAAGGLWVKEIGGVPSDGESEPWYPSPKGGTVSKWKESYAKAANMVGQMTIIEKVNVTTGTGWRMGMCVGNTAAVNRLGFPSLCLQDGPLGLRFVDNATAWPAGITTGATWNKDLMYRRGQAHGFEAKKKGINVILGPSMGALGRLPAGGRNWEGFGADPVLQAVGAAQTIKGIQDAGVMATAKHFVGNEQEHFRQSFEWGLPNSLSSNIDDRTLHEIYAWPFAESVRAGVASIMCSYNQVNNSYACQNSKLMNGILKDELGFQGFIQSDWLAQRAGVASTLAGLDMTMPGDGLRWQDGDTLWGGELTKSVLNGSVRMERLNDMALRVVAAWYQLGQDDSSQWPNGSLSSSATFSSWTNDEVGKLYEGSPDSTETGLVNQFVPVRVTEEGGDHEKLAREIAAEGIVMVKNDDNILPLAKDGSNIHSNRTGKKPGEKIKVGIFGLDAFSHPKGPNSCPDRSCNEYTLAVGWGSGSSEFPYLVSPFDALNATFDHSAVEVSDFPHNGIKLVDRTSGKQDLCIVFLNSDSGEGYLEWNHVKGDRIDLMPQNHGHFLAEEVAKSCGGKNPDDSPNSNTIAVLHNVGPTLLESWIDLPGLKSLLIAHLPGQESGNALADVIFGDVNPSGHLPYTIAHKEEDYGPNSKILTKPNHLVPQQDFTEGWAFDYRYFDQQNITPRYPFGYGMSYTTFVLDPVELTLLAQKISPTPAARPKDEVSPPKLDTTLPDPQSAVFPKNFHKVKNFIYAYLSRASDAKPHGTPSFPYGYGKHDTPHSTSPAGGAEGGNPDLWTEIVSVKARVRNTGNMEGKAVVQVYISFPPESENELEEGFFPKKVLRGFEKVNVPVEVGFGRGKSEGVEVEVRLTRKDLSFWSVQEQNWVLPKGGFGVLVGFGSGDFEGVGATGVQGTVTVRD
ncbi:beta-glucosidase like protein [Zymoseptoria brevis]|uniref:Probable beta-glucosidase E n=1 Tax=Zymoseptoria brevis TaxID=1047168 RepID=A0A0F4GGS5_9PEZI|nr:beta-glucosidase like protein [Zymoseptoria brevis]